MRLSVWDEVMCCISVCMYMLTLARLTGNSLECLLLLQPAARTAPPGKVPGRGVPKAKGRGRSGVVIFAFHFRFRRPTQAPRRFHSRQPWPTTSTSSSMEKTRCRWCRYISAMTMMMASEKAGRRIGARSVYPCYCNKDNATMYDVYLRNYNIQSKTNYLFCYSLNKHDRLKWLSWPNTTLYNYCFSCVRYWVRSRVVTCSSKFLHVLQTSNNRNNL